MPQTNLPTTALLASLLEPALERFLALSPRQRELLAPLAGKHIELKLRHPALRLHLFPTDATIQVQDDAEGAADVTLSGSWLAFLRMKLSGDPQRSLFGGDIRIDGDTATARQFQHLLDRLDIDWEGLLTGRIGAGPAAYLTEWFGQVRRWTADTVSTLQTDCAEYLQEESRALPAVTENEAFLRDVDDLRAAADRLEARIERLHPDTTP